ncbi:DNA-formamidopyrimidine glycosylase [Candidatus Pantoea edessiphila]|uniref:Formamidopyrimidine-DNA glycosylase n=1 Tax=Candidatus Pantoea edessiphila TaxID=2044610 RepID=A0A2P5T1A4_9GAMM|nr:bifunctional DNA-formamidopyrimidine glycosylase/DNA-(apurinic or apyrimidinic site) lyase [Candidatus Pantoea edessiphila]PPI88379.1 DNA-formamidopyrimidine glycosylase [Candidatus Pantoea edessiphila]
MPELPEVESYRISIEPYLLNQVITHIIVRNVNLRYPVSDKIIKIENQVILSIKRRAKYLILELNQGFIIIHFGMSGKLTLLNRYIFPKKHDHIDVFIKNGNILRYTDERRFGLFLWSDDLLKNRLFQHLGVEPLSDEFNTNYLIKKLSSRKTIIKQVVMNNKIVVGIGNIYANESLFAAGIIPMRPSISLNIQEIELLVNSIKMILLQSIEKGGTTFRNFLQSNGKPGCFTEKLKVYGRANKPCLICKRYIIKEMHIKRSSYWCPNCQC